MAESDTDPTGFLLQRLQELKAWQQEQEDKLMKEQEEQMEHLYLETREEGGVRRTIADSFDDDEDDDTIDQDISSIVSYEGAPPNGVHELPSWAQTDAPPPSARGRRSNGNNHDDVPIAANEKSFQELLSEQLALNGLEEKPAEETETKPDDRRSSSAKPFLRRGSGLSRYGGVCGSPNGVIRRINSTGKLQTRNFPKATTKLRSSASCSKLGSKPKPSIKKKPAAKRRINEAVVLAAAPGPYDSVELSFMEKLATANRSHRKEMEDLVAFEMLEEAACDSSFCSSSSTVKKLIRSSLPSPVQKQRKDPELTSTPKSNGNGRSKKELQFDEDEPRKDSELMKDIQAFLTSKGATVVVEQSDDDDTLKDLEEMSDRKSDGSESEGWSDAEEAPKNGGDKRKVRFKEDGDDDLAFSPPRMPKNSPSYLIWSIFTKEREERQKRQMQKMEAEVAEKPLSSYPPGVNGFESTLLNAKLAELEKEVSLFKKENAALEGGRRKLNADRKQLAKEAREFEEGREKERKKLEEEKKRARREKALLEKAQKDAKRSSTFDRKAQEEIDELQAKVAKLNEELERKECKWTNTLNKYQDQLKFLERENQQLHEENHKLKLKFVSPKVSTRLIDPAKKVILQDATNKPSLEKSPPAKANGGGDVATTNGSVPLTLQGVTFSPTDSLDSSFTLVSAGVTTTTGSEARQKTAAAARVASVRRDEEKGTTEKVYDDGRVEVCYPNGNRKETSADGMTVRVLYYNGDVKENLQSGLVKYFYSQTKTWHLTYPDGKEVLQFSNGQEEIRYPNGVLQISFADGSVKKIANDGSENIVFTDGTQVLVMPNGDRTLLMTNGQREIHTPEFKRREYPDGTVKILYEDGRQETRYSSGRVRVKDKSGALLQDSSLTTAPHATSSSSG